MYSELSLEGLDRYDVLVVAPLARDALLACFDRLRAERDAGKRVLLIALFESPSRRSRWKDGGAGARRHRDRRHPPGPRPGPDEA